MNFLFKNYTTKRYRKVPNFSLSELRIAYFQHKIQRMKFGQ